MWDYGAKSWQSLPAGPSHCYYPLGPFSVATSSELTREIVFSLCIIMYLIKMNQVQNRTAPIKSSQVTRMKNLKEKKKFKARLYSSVSYSAAGKVRCEFHILSLCMGPVGIYMHRDTSSLLPSFEKGKKWNGGGGEGQGHLRNVILSVSYKCTFLQGLLPC